MRMISNSSLGDLCLRPNDTLGAHYHDQVEETFYFPEGEPKMIVGGKDYRVRPGDVFKVSPGEAHDIINDTDGPTKLTFIKLPYISDDKVSV